MTNMINLIKGRVDYFRSIFTMGGSLQWRPYLFCITMPMFFTAFLVQDIHRVKHTELSKVLSEVQAQDLLPFLRAAGVWSPEQLVAVGIHTLPRHLLADRTIRATVQVRTMLPCGTQDNLSSIATSHDLQDNLYH